MASGSSSDTFTNNVGEDIEAGSNNGHISDAESTASGAEKTYGEDMDGHVADIDKWADSLKRILEDVPQYMCRPGHPGRISRIPENLREIDVKAYEPYFLSIGPYHHGKPGLEEMEQRKQLLLKGFLKHKPELIVKDYLTEIQKIEPAAMRFYSDINMTSEKFVQMLLLDSLFILATFCGIPRNQEQRNQRGTVAGSIEDNESMNGQSNEQDESMGAMDDNGETQKMITEDEPTEDTESELTFTPRLLSAMFAHDLLLLENQIPFSVLQKMHTLVYGGTETELIRIMKFVVCNMLRDYTKLESELVISPNEEVHHLLHLCHLFFRPTLQHESTTSKFIESSHMFRLGSAAQLYESGVSFVAISDSSQHSLLDITFCSSGKMAMPCLHVDDNTNSLLRNLIALEQMKYPNMGLHVSAYAVLLLHLITRPEDAGLLRRKGIIQHQLASDKELMYFVNRLSVGLAFDYVEDNYSLRPVFQELKSYSERKVPRWRAWLKHRHCRNPWTVMSLMAASLLLFLTTLQTYYTVYSYYHPYFGGHI